MKIPVILNDEEKILDAEPDWNLMKVLQNNGCTSVKCGCSSGSCGSCSVLLNGIPVASCKIPVGIIKSEKIITLERGLIGLEQFTQYTILYDCEKEDANISWLQSVEEPTLALPVIKPWIIKEDYNPIVEDELLSGLGELTEDNLVILLTVTVPKEVEEMSVNLKAPIVINADMS